MSLDPKCACATSCPSCGTEYEVMAYTEWLVLADRAIERGLNANAIWRLHEHYKRDHHGGVYDVGGEA